MSNSDNIIDFESGKLDYLQKQKARRAEEMRKAFREARAESSPKPKTRSQKRRRRNAKK